MVKKLLPIMLLFASCSLDNAMSPDNNQLTVGSIRFTAIREKDTTTKATIDEGTIKWEVGDQIDISDGNRTETITLSADNISENGLVAFFTTNKLNTCASKYYAAYPHSNVFSFNDGKVEFKRLLSIDNTNAISAVSQSDSMTFSFRNIFQLLKIDTNLKDASYIRFTGNNKEYTYTDIAFNTIDGSLSSKSNKISYAIWSKITNGTCYIPLLPEQTFQNGFKIHVYNSSHEEFAFFNYTDQFNTIRNHITVISDFDKRLTYSASLPEIVYPGNYITYQPNYDYFPHGDNVTLFRSYFSSRTSDIGAIEMKFQLTSINDNYETYALVSGNASREESTLRITSRGLCSEYCTNNGSNTYEYTWSALGVKQTDVIVLKISSIDRSFIVNGKNLDYHFGNSSVFENGVEYLFSDYYREYDEGWWISWSGLPTDSKIYYAKIWDTSGKLVYVGYPSIDINPELNQIERCWHSSFNGLELNEFPHYSDRISYVQYGGN